MIVAVMMMMMMMDRPRISERQLSRPSVVCFFRDFTHHFPVNDRIEIFTKHVQHPPVAHRHFVRHGFGDVVGYQPVVAVPQCVLPSGRVVHDQHPVTDH